ncbi:Bax inhibitor-1 family protein (plasmid) [Aneurinibacillus sp. Ricciae_BoGa-3]|uniref:Bax inhibitor-1/YccA family protein n=1 Tax=Aneurinibacillus sp. Ricciae_BoGa-3 TaxID=3022697 RepID=UPI0023425D94|nr:Bax inhibitor-1 family protein [Aneurinibacillus sp. Ricciae_BoGa-3]WCK57269.1 Bax inhibitor-1 family protein [Aneurinibacillus sp. Ricciae_BoGa-3]
MSYPFDAPERANQDNILKVVMQKFFVAMLIVFIGMVIGMKFVPITLVNIVPIITLVCIIWAVMVRGSRSSRHSYKESNPVSMGFVYFISFTIGVGIYPAIVYHVSHTGATMVLTALGITTALFGGLTLYASTSQRSFVSWGTTLFFSLLLIIIFSIVNLFLHAPLLFLALSIVGAIVFSAYVLYDISIIRNSDITEEDVPFAVLNLVLDFVNLFEEILNIVSFFRR